MDRGQASVLIVLILPAVFSTVNDIVLFDLLTHFSQSAWCSIKRVSLLLLRAVIGSCSWSPEFSDVKCCSTRHSPLPLQWRLLGAVVRRHGSLVRNIGMGVISVFPSQESQKRSTRKKSSWLKLNLGKTEDSSLLGNYAPSVPPIYEALSTLFHAFITSRTR